MLRDWLKKIAPLSEPIRSKYKKKTMMTYSPVFSFAWCLLHIVLSSSDWFIVSFVPVVIGQSYSFGFGFTTHN